MCPGALSCSWKVLGTRALIGREDVFGGVCTSVVRAYEATTAECECTELSLSAHGVAQRLARQQWARRTSTATR